MLPLWDWVDLGAMATKIYSQNSWAGASTSDGLMSYPRHSLGESFLSAEMQSVYATVSTDLAIFYKCSDWAGLLTEDSNSMYLSFFWEKIKFVEVWVILKASLVLNRVIFLGGFSELLTVIQTGNLNSKFKQLVLQLSRSDISSKT